MNLLSFYDNTLEYAGLKTDEDGFTYVNLDPENPQPANLKIDSNTKRLILPTSQNLRNDNWDHLVVYHPLKENVMHGESKVIEYLRKAINYRVNLVYSTLVADVLALACETKYHTKLSAEVTKLLAVVKDADEKTLGLWEKIISNISVTDTKAHLTNIYLRKLGKMDGHQFFCLGIWTFPLLRDLKEAHERDDKTFHGAKFRKKDWEILINLLEYIMPNSGEQAEVEKHYRFGSNFQRAPFLDSLLRTSMLVTDNLNKVTDTLYKGRSHLPKEEKEALHDYLYFDTSFLSVLDDVEGTVDTELKLIPSQPGNDAPKQTRDAFNEVVAAEPVQEKVTKANKFETLTTPAAGAAVASPTTLVEQVAPVQEQTNGVSVASMMMAQQPQVGMGMQYNPMIPQQSGMYPQQPMMQSTGMGLTLQVPQPQPMFQPRIPGQQQMQQPMQQAWNNTPPWEPQPQMQQGWAMQPQLQQPVQQVQQPVTMLGSKAPSGGGMHAPVNYQKPQSIGL